MSESSEQQALIQWFKLQYSQYRLVAIPNGQWIAGVGKQKFALINKYKAEGLTPGVSDLFLCVPTEKHAGLWIEMKDKGKTKSSISESQKQWLSDMILAGYLAKVAYGFDEAKAIIQDYINGYYNDPYEVNKA